MAETCRSLCSNYQNIVQPIGSKFVCKDVVFVRLTLRQAVPAAEDKSRVNLPLCKPWKHKSNGNKSLFILIPKTAWGGAVQMVFLAE